MNLNRHTDGTLSIKGDGRRTLGVRVSVDRTK